MNGSLLTGDGDQPVSGSLRHLDDGGYDLVCHRVGRLQEASQYAVRLLVDLGLEPGDHLLGISVRVAVPNIVVPGHN